MTDEELKDKARQAVLWLKVHASLNGLPDYTLVDHMALALAYAAQETKQSPTVWIGRLMSGNFEYVEPTPKWTYDDLPSTHREACQSFEGNMYKKEEGERLASCPGLPEDYRDVDLMFDKQTEREQCVDRVNRPALPDYGAVGTWSDYEYAYYGQVYGTGRVEKHSNLD